MIKLKFGWTNVDVSIIGQGTWMIENSGDSNSKNLLAIKALQLALDLGMNHIDTAEMYGNGKAEELVGQAIEDEEERHIFSWSKVLPSDASYESTIRASRIVCKD